MMGRAAVAFEADAIRLYYARHFWKEICLDTLVPLRSTHRPLKLLPRSPRGERSKDRETERGGFVQGSGLFSLA